MDSKEFVRGVTGIYPALLADLVRLMYEYFVPCPITWQKVIPVTPISNANLLADHQIPVGWRTPLEVKASPQESTQVLSFKDAPLLVGLRTTPLTSCTQTHFSIRLRANGASIRFQAKCSGNEAKRSDGQTFTLLWPRGIPGGAVYREMVFDCTKEEEQMTVQVRYPHPSFEVVNDKSEHFAFPNGHSLEILFYDRSIRRARVQFAEIV